TPVWEGEIWSFSTVEGFVVDDFEDYSADVPIWESWLDGLGFGSPGTPDFNPGNGTGSAVGDDTTGSTTEETIVNSGRQSMPFFYDNNKQGSANYSETEHTLDQTGNWTERGVTELSLWFRGYPASVGSFVEAPAGTFTMTGSGADIWAVDGVEADEFHFAYKMLNGAGSIIVKVESVQNTNEWAKAGVMIRETLDPGSAHATVVITPEQGVSFQRRFVTAGTSTDETTGGITAPHWVKIERSMSGTFTASHSTNGTTWQPLGTPQNIQMNANVHVGLALTAHDPALTCEAVFSNITMTGAVTGQWVNQDIGIASNDPEPMYVALADSTGALGVVAHEDPAATQIDTWIQWSIDLTEFGDQGVDLTGIQKMLIGVGDRTNPITGGSGKMYFDDIMVGNPVPEREVKNLLVNGGFENGVLDPWYIYDDNGDATAEVVGDDPVEGSSSLHVVVPTAGANFYNVGLVQPGLIMEAGKKYTLSAFVKCSEGTLDISFKPEHAAAPYEGYGDQVITVTDQWAEYSVTTPVIGADVDPAATTFHIGFTPGEFWMDNVRFYEGDYTPPE
ncbi:MAG: carbohydrate binding domain-containing protein, partial [Planctomycetota bacterium]